MRVILLLGILAPALAQACSGLYVQETITSARQVAAAGLSLSLVFFATTLIGSWRKRVPKWLPVATGLLVAINPFRFDSGYRGDCGSTIETLSPLFAYISGLVSVVAWIWCRNRLQKQSE